MKKSAIGFLLAALLSFGATALAIHKTQPEDIITSLPKEDASSVYIYITSVNPYDMWSLWPDKGRMYKGAHPHGAFLTTYINDYAALGIKEGKRMPHGSMIVKENYSQEKKLAAITVMYKIDGYNPDAGNWFWAKYEPDGKPLASGKVPECINCHKSRMENDYIMTADFVKE